MKKIDKCSTKRIKACVIEKKSNKNEIRKEKTLKKLNYCDIDFTSFNHIRYIR